MASARRGGVAAGFAVAAAAVLLWARRRRQQQRSAAGVSVRAATPDDLGAIVAMTNAMATETEGVTLPPGAVDRGVRLALTGATGLRPRYWVSCEPDGRPIGLVGVSPEWSDWWGCEYWWIIAVYVKKSKREKGIAQGLLRAVLAEAEARGVQTVNLRVEKDNAAAQGLYRTCGFAVDASHLVMAYGRTPSGVTVGAAAAAAAAD